MNRQAVHQINATHRQRGAVMIIGLVMVLLMTIVGMAAIRGSGLQETMAGNMRERTIAFQSAEAGLRAGEEFAEDNTLDILSLGSVDGFYDDLSLDDDPGPVSEWTKQDWTDEAVEVEFDLPEVAGQPRYLIERIDVSPQQIRKMLGHGVGVSDSALPEPSFYRISSRGLDRTGVSGAVVQSLYIKN